MSLVTLIVCGVATVSTSAAADAQRPNVVLIMTDNHGAWSLGCYGNPDIRTPNIDSMARQGVLFTRCYSSNAVCSPTRATFLTGLLPSQHGVHSWLAGGRLQMVDGKLKDRPCYQPHVNAPAAHDPQFGDHSGCEIRSGGPFIVPHNDHRTNSPSRRAGATGGLSASVCQSNQRCLPPQHTGERYASNRPRIHVAFLSLTYTGRLA